VRSRHASPASPDMRGLRLVMADRVACSARRI
jgi:hypothetical protein